MRKRAARRPSTLSEEARLLLLAEAAPCVLWHATAEERGDGPLHWDIELNVPAAEQFFQIERSGELSYVEAWRRSRLDGDRERCERTADTAVRAGEGYYEEYRCRRADGKVRWLADHVRVEPISPGRWRVLGVTLDVTARRRAEEELREVNERMRFALEGAHTHLWEFDPATGAYWSSPNCEAVLGSHPPTYAEFLEITHPEDRSRLVEVATSEQVAEFDSRFRVVWPDGSLHWVQGRGRLIRDEAGNIRKVAGTGTNITDRKRVEAALQESEERLRLAVEAAGIIDWSWDLVRGACRSPEALRRVLGYPVGTYEPTFEWWEERIHPEDRPDVLAGIDEFLGGSEPRWADEYRFRRVDGTYAWIADCATVTRDENGRPVHVFGAMLDITATRDLQQQLTQAQKMEAVGRLAGGVAHDFNNMLAVINGYSDLILADGGGDSRTLGNVREIREAGSRAAEITRQLLAFSRKQLVNPEVLDLADVLGSTYRMLRRLIGEDIELSTRIQAGVAPVYLDRGQLEQVLLNLAVNARDAMPRGGRLTFHLENVTLPARRTVSPLAPGTYVKLAVADTGAGIPADVLPHIFEPFFTTKGREEGTGLGLATVYGIMTQCGGSIDVESQVGIGTAFSLYFPQYNLAPVARREAEASPAFVPGKGRVLVVEDEPTVRRLVVQVLKTSGYEVSEAESMASALELLGPSADCFDLLLTDVVMPGGSGRDLAETARYANPDLSVLYMSGYTDDAVIRNGVSSAEVQLLQKPFTPAALTRRVRELLTDARDRDR